MRADRLLFVTGVLCALAACEGREQPPAVTPAVATPPSQTKISEGSEAILQHMHRHAAQLSNLNTALADGDLDAAATPAYWLARHKTIDGLPRGWGPYVDTMRREAQAVENATDLESARAAAGRLADGCRGCHESNGVDVTIP